MTIRSRERVVLVHYCRNALVATSLRYEDEILDPENATELSNFPAPGEKELHLAKEIVDRMTRSLDLASYKDSLKTKIESLAKSECILKNAMSTTAQ